jgi:peptidoglycan-associated lipoprotein
MKKIILLFSILFFAFFANAQTILQKADSSFKNKNYMTSIELYTKVLKKATSEETKYIYYQMGECYRIGNNYSEARSWYQKAITAGNTQPMLDYYMGDMILKSGEYAEAKTYFEKYLTVNPNDNLAKMKLESCNLGLAGQKAKPLYSIEVDKNMSSIASDYGIAFFKNNKVIFSSTRFEGSSKYDPSTLQGFSDLYEATYDPQSGKYSNVSKVKGTINTGFNEGTFAFDPATNYGYYSQCNGGSGKLKQCNIMYAHYNETTNTWENSTLFAFNSQTFRSQQQSLSVDGKTLYFSSDMPGGIGGADIYKITKSGDTWGQPENLGSTINTIGDDMFPFISGDSLLIFASDGHAGLGGLDIFASHIVNGKFSKPVNLGVPFNSSADDFGLIIKDGWNNGLFSSNRTGGVGDDDIYTFTKIPVILSASGNIKDKASNKNLENAVAIFKGSDGSIDSVITDSKGNYTFDKMKPGIKYAIKATKVGYLNDSKNLTIGNELYSKEYNKSTGSDLDFFLMKITKEEIKIDNIYYDLAKWDIRESSKPELDKLINVLKETPEVKVQISAHTDDQGKDDYNMDLSQKRAQSVVDYLIAGGISADRLIAKGYGESQLIIKKAKTDEQHQMNRRTTFKILNSDDVNTGSSMIAPVKEKPVVSKQTDLNTIKSTTQTTNTTTTTTTTTTQNTSINLSTANTTPTSTSNVTTSDKYFIISGSFKTEAEANAGIKALNEKGYKNASVVGKAPNGYIRICYNSFSKKEEAMKELETIKKSVNSSAWLFEKTE